MVVAILILWIIDISSASVVIPGFAYGILWIATCIYWLLLVAGNSDGRF
jgi:hypothetical protein